MLNKEVDNMDYIQEPQSEDCSIYDDPEQRRLCEERNREAALRYQKTMVDAMQKEQQSQSQGSAPQVNPMQAYNMYSKFAGGGSGGGGASGGGGWMSAAAPWLGVAALGVWNEHNQRKAGNRSEDDMEYLGDLLTGKVIEQDATRLAGGDKDDFFVVGTELANPIRAPKHLWEDPERYLKIWDYF